jgi:hypothetical protein
VGDVLRRIVIAVPDSVAERLDRLAAAEFRDRKQQATVLLVGAIERAERRARAAAAGADAK